MISLLLITLLAGDPAAQGFSAETLAAQTQPAIQTVDPALNARMDVLRHAMIANPVEAASLLDPMERRALQSALGALDQNNAAALSWFFRSASMRTGARADIVGFYNPIVDAWLVMRVAYAAGAWRVADARLLDAAALRGPNAPYWTETDDNALAVLAQNQRTTMAAFDTLSNVPPDTERTAFHTIADRMRAWSASTAAWGNAPETAAAAEQVRAAIARGRVARLAPANTTWRGREIDALPQAVRASFAVTAAAARGDGATVFLISPLAPEIIIVLDMRGHAPAGLSVVNLANAAHSGVAP